LRVLVTAATRHEATGEIAEAIAAGLAKRGVEAEARPITEVGDVDGYDAVVLGSAIYVGRWLTEAGRFAERHAATLASLPVWLFSSGPIGAHAPEWECADAATLAQTTGARAHRVFAGRIERARLGFAERLVARAAAPRDRDDRDWLAIDEYAAEIAAELAAQPLDRAVHDPAPARSDRGAGAP
jgi:menaquinone-dependent protoporphyrinogen oxidase